MIIYEKLLAIQTELKAPKNQWNEFGNFKYRSCEDILEAVKPLLTKNKATLYFVDNVRQIGERYYIEATVFFIDLESGEHTTTTAFAREDATKKGMDGSQITGASSSYARKYALNGLFAIDDNKDSDDPTPGNNAPQPPEPEQPKKLTPRKQLIAALKAKGIDIDVYAQKHNLKPDTPSEVFVALLKELEASNGV